MAIGAVTIIKSGTQSDSTKKQRLLLVPNRMTSYLERLAQTPLTVGRVTIKLVITAAKIPLTAVLEMMTCMVPMTTTQLGSDGNDTVHGEAGNDVLFGGDDDDTLYGNNLNDTMHGGAGDDALQGSAGNDNLSGDLGVDALHGGLDNDTLTVGQGADTLFVS